MGECAIKEFCGCYFKEDPVFDLFWQIYTTNTDYGIIAINKEKEPIYISKSIIKLFNATCGEELAQNLYDYIDEDALLFKVFDAKRPLTGLMYLKKGEQNGPLQTNVYPLYEQGELHGAFGCFFRKTTQQSMPGQIPFENLTLILAHELGNPLSLIKGCAQIMTKKPEHMERFIKVLLKETDRMESLINGILKLTRPFELKKEWADMHTILDEVLILFESSFQENKVKLKREYKATDGSVHLDVAKLKQVWINLIANALDAMGGGGILTIETKDTPCKHGIEVHITDTGEGIKEKDQHYVFLPFYSTKKDQGGSGVGLTICQQIITEHGGQIQVNTSRGGGTTFTVTLLRQKS